MTGCSWDSSFDASRRVRFFNNIFRDPEASRSILMLHFRQLNTSLPFNPSERFLMRRMSRAVDYAVRFNVTVATILSNFSGTTLLEKIESIDLTGVLSNSIILPSGSNSTTRIR